MTAKGNTAFASTINGASAFVGMKSIPALTALRLWTTTKGEITRAQTFAPHPPRRTPP